MKLKHIVTIGLALSVSQAAFAAGENFFGLGVGTTGFTAEYGYDLNEKWTIRPNFSMIKMEHDKTIKKVDYKGDGEMIFGGVNVDFYPLEQSNHYLSAGLLFNGTNVKGNGEVKLGKNMLGATKIETDVRVNYNKVAPYLGFGYRSNDANEGDWQFSYNVGVIYQGKGKVLQGDFCVDGLMATCIPDAEAQNHALLNMNAVKKHFDYHEYKEKVRSEAEKYKFIPVVRATVLKRF